MKYKCIIFDCDGVLVDSEAISSSVLTEMANELGASLSQHDVLEHFTGKSLKFCLEYIEDELGKALPRDFEPEFRRRSFLEFATHLQPIDGIHEVIKNLKVPFCVASSGPMEKIIRNLKTVHLFDFFEGKIFSSYEILSWKPNPEIYWHAAKTMGFDVHECLIIEDSITGIQAAQSGGFDVVAFVNDNNKKRFQNENIRIFFSMKELNVFLNTTH